MIVKLLLLAGLAVAVFLAMRTQAKGDHLAIRRLLAGGFLAVGALAVVLPQTTTYVANLIGVGRGTDLLLYVTVVAFLFVTIGLYQRIHSLERRLTELARELALRTADRPTQDR